MTVVFSSAAVISKVTPAPSFNQSFTVNSASNRLLIVCLAVEAGATLNGVSYAGTNMEFYGTASFFRIYYLVNPASGSNNITMHLNTSYMYVGGWASDWSGASQSSPIGSVVAGNKNTGTITVAEGGQAFAVLTSLYGSTPATGCNPPAIYLGNFIPNQMSGVAAARITSTGSVVFTGGSDNTSGSAGIPINPAAAAAGSNPAKRAFPYPILQH